MAGFVSRLRAVLPSNLLALVVWIAVQAAANARVDHFEAPCARCHLDGKAVTAENAHRLTSSQESLCGSCHQGTVVASHPTGFPPNRPLPGEFPLDWKGEVTCSTCHAVHDEPSDEAQVAAGRGRALCLSCHPRAFFDDMADGGGSLLDSAHLAGRRHPRSSPVDAFSMQCVVCHETRLSLPGDGIRAAFTASNGTGMVNHPIGAPVDRTGLPNGMLLPDGRVSCLSCHQGYSQEHGALLESDRGLCRDCHEK